MDIENSIAWQLRRLVGAVTDKVLAADKQRVAADLELVGDRIVDSGLDAVARNRRDLVARQNLDIVIGIPKGAIGGELQCRQEARVDQRVARIKLQRGRVEIDLGLDALASGRADVLEKTKALQHGARNGHDVVVVPRADDGHR